MTGVYQIRNTINNKIYVGSSSRNLLFRRNQHFSELAKNKHPNKKLQNSYNKHGKNNFIFEILSKCPPEYCIKLEQWFIDNLKPQYNIRKLANSNKGIKLSLEQKLKISLSKKGVSIKGHPCSENLKCYYSILYTGRKLSEETKRKMKGRKHTKESKIKIGLASKNIDKNKIKERSNKIKKKIVQYDLNNNFIQEWDSASDAAKHYNCNRGNITNVCKGKRKSTLNFKWYYK